MNLTRSQAASVLLARQNADRYLAGYARYIDIPGVPVDEDVDDRTYQVVETELAAHHLLILNTLQAMVEGRLRFDPETLTGSMGYDALLADPCMAHGGRVGGGGGAYKTDTPAANSEIPNSPPNPIQLPQTRMVDPILHEGLLIDAGYHGVVTPKSPEQLIFESTYSGICKRVMIMLPPGSAKSTYASVVFPTWVMGKVKQFETILTGWGDPICRRHGKRARQICASPAYKELFGTGLDPDTRSAEDWALKNESSYKSSGINSGVAGFRTHGLIWDDLTKNRKEADSFTIREDVFNAYIDDARSRKTPTAWEVGIGTRWHEDEIMGRILPEGYAGESGFMECRDGNVWFVICMAAECEDINDPLGRSIGEMIWPEWFGEEYWAEKRRNPRSWASLYQQRPAPEEGLYFKQDWFRRYDEIPQGCNTYISYDPAVSDEETADETAMHVWKVDQMGRAYLVDEWVAQVTMDVWIDQLILWAGIHKPMELISEAGIIRRASEPFLKRAMIKTKKFFTCTWITRNADKSAMARPAQAMAASGQIYLPKTSVGDDFLAEMMMFPASNKDHRVDSLANFCLRLEAIWDANPVETTSKKPDMIFGELKVKDLMPPRIARKKSRWSNRRYRAS